MASGLHVIVVLCLTSGLWVGADARCGKGWSWFDDHCYRFFGNAMEWAEAERRCTDVGATLPSIQNPLVYNFIRELIVKRTKANTDSWVGGSDAQKEGAWLWIGGGKFAFNHWGPGEPNNVGGHENCMEMNLGGRDYVNDANCDLKRPFVCVKKHHKLQLPHHHQHPVDPTHHAHHA